MGEHQPAEATITIAIVSWNTRALLAECLDSLHEDARSGLADVWVHDNASSDGSAEMVRERFPWVQLIASSQNLGFGPAVNEVAARTRSTWIAPANADLRFSPGALSCLVAEGERSPTAGVIAPRLVLADDTTQHSVFPFPTIPFALALVSGAVGRSSHLAQHWHIAGGFDPDRAQEVAWAVGAFLLVRRAAWDQIGGFDNAQWMYAEDLDLGWRLKRAGWITRYLPDAVVNHAESASTIQAWGEARHDKWHASTYAWLLRRHGPLVARATALIYVGGYLAHAAARTPAALAGSESARRARDKALATARAHMVGLQPRRVLEHVR